MRIVICDDDANQVKHLRTLLGKWTKEREISDAELETFSSAESFLFAYEDNKLIDILLLDIQMGEMDGLSLAKTIRPQDKSMQIIFITGYMDYILDGYDVDALNYLLKPVSQEKLFATLDKATKRLSFNEKAIFISHQGENLRIPLHEIRYLEVLHNHVTIHATNSYTIKKTLKELQENLDENFFRTGRSYIVNLRHIQKTTKTQAHLSCGTTIPLSRGIHNPLNQAIIKRI